MENIRTNPKMINRILADYFEIPLTDDQELTKEYISLYKKELLSFTNKASQPLNTLKQELVALSLNCSDDVREIVEQLHKMTEDYTNELLSSLLLASEENLKELIRHLKSFSNKERWEKLETLEAELTGIMKKEIKHFYSILKID